jgi:hypothetical protein
MPPDSRSGIMHVDFTVKEGVDSFPRICRTDSHIVEPGYAVGIGHRFHGQSWWFFTERTYALVFGALARYGARGVAGYGVYPAVYEKVYDDRTESDSDTLHVGLESIDRLGADSRWEELVSVLSSALDRAKTLLELRIKERT